MRNPNAESAAVANRTKGKRVLLVEDNINQQRMCILAFRCKFPHHEMKAASTGREALRIAKDFSPEVVLVDFGLPDMDGSELGKLLREDAGLENAVFISLSGSGEPEDFQRSEAAGYVKHVVKPPDLDELERGFWA
ncbi:response regulator [Pelagicoccus sp. SDUM812005]|uniref:response regulator n=1 Tax=Pelagicoccus sp. SDUM812005 TaxID=3041257 RepID=UPI00280EA09F|nr:response regulator [Pelagicoccus sp. SDUM812005]MDQ8181081.1 response regulator [Pelagicoccus sp. SDUM812005]